jgi:IclR family acetate operon transcriptional repressor
MKTHNNAAKNVRMSKRATTETRGDTVQSLLRALTLLNALAASERGLTLSETARKGGLAVSTAHRLLSTLQKEHFVRFDAERGVWMIGVQSFVVGSAFLRTRDLTAVARPVMRDLMERSGETVNLAVEDRGEAIYIAQIESPMTMRAIARPGGRAAMHASGVGKALLAAMTDKDAERVVAAHGLAGATENTITEVSKLAAELKKTRERGFAIDDEENAIGLRCVAAPIFDENANAIAAISLSGPTARIGDANLESLGQETQAAARRITLALGGAEQRGS